MEPISLARLQQTPKERHGPIELPSKLDPNDTSITWRWVEDWLYGPHVPKREYVWLVAAKRYAETQNLSNVDLERNWTENHPIIKFWSLLWQACRYAFLDVLLPDPDAQEEMHVFCGLVTFKIAMASDDSVRIVKGPVKIIDQWQSLKAAGFKRITAVFVKPDKPNQAWFFEGGEFISVSWEPGFKNDVLLEGPTPIADGWKCLKMGGFLTVGGFVPNHQFPDQPWVFSGDICARISISTDTILAGPFVIPESWTSSSGLIVDSVTPQQPIFCL